MSQIDTIVVHHTATPTSWSVQQLRDLHVNQNGWRDIGYHYVVRLSGDTAVTQIGRPHDGDNNLESWEYGAHAYGSNSHTLGICTVGNWSMQSMLPEIERELIAALVHLCIQHGLDPLTQIKGHREMALANTECPGSLVDLDTLRLRVYKYHEQVLDIKEGMTRWENLNQ